MYSDDNNTSVPTSRLQYHAPSRDEWLTMPRPLMLTIVRSVQIIVQMIKMSKQIEQSTTRI